MATFGNIEAQLAPEPVAEAPKLPTSQRKLKPGLTISNLAAEVFSVRFSPDGRYLAAGCGDGAIRVFNASTERKAPTSRRTRQMDYLPPSLDSDPTAATARRTCCSRRTRTAASSTGTFLLKLLHAFPREGRLQSSLRVGL